VTLPDFEQQAPWCVKTRKLGVFDGGSYNEFGCIVVKLLMCVNDMMRMNWGVTWPNQLSRAFLALLDRLFQCLLPEGFHAQDQDQILLAAGCLRAVCPKMQVPGGHHQVDERALQAKGSNHQRQQMVRSSTVELQAYKK
jgi:hypothetical protein